MIHPISIPIILHRIHGNGSYIYLEPSHDLYFWRSFHPQNKAFSNQNKGHSGFRYLHEYNQLLRYSKYTRFSHGNPSWVRMPFILHTWFLSEISGRICFLWSFQKKNTKYDHLAYRAASPPVKSNVLQMVMLPWKPTNIYPEMFNDSFTWNL